MSFSIWDPQSNLDVSEIISHWVNREEKEMMALGNPPWKRALGTSFYLNFTMDATGINVITFGI
jgi:hypothetical protein